MAVPAHVRAAFGAHTQAVLAHGVAAPAFRIMLAAITAHESAAVHATNRVRVVKHLVAVPAFALHGGLAVVSGIHVFTLLSRFVLPDEAHQAHGSRASANRAAIRCAWYPPRGHACLMDARVFATLRPARMMGLGRKSTRCTSVQAACAALFRQEGRDGGEREIVRGVAALRFSVFQDSTNSVIHVV